MLHSHKQRKCPQANIFASLLHRGSRISLLLLHTSRTRVHKPRPKFLASQIAQRTRHESWSHKCVREHIHGRPRTTMCELTYNANIFASTLSSALWCNTTPGKHACLRAQTCILVCVHAHMCANACIRAGTCACVHEHMMHACPCSHIFQLLQLHCTRVQRAKGLKEVQTALFLPFWLSEHSE